jgi:Domain of unknown function (DUF4192)
MSGVAPARQVLKLSGPPDVVAAVPYVVGFQPVESLVVIALKGPRQGILHTLRVDLRDVAEVRRQAWTDQPCHPHTIAATLKRNGATGALVVILTEQPPEAADDIAGRSLADELCAELKRVRIPVRDAMLVRDGRWFSYLCSNPECCPPEGTPVQGAAHDRVAAELAFAGEAPLRDRAQIEERVAPERGFRAQAVEVAVDALLEGGPSDEEGSPIDVLRAAFQQVRAGETLDPQTAALCLIWLPGFAVRDACMQPWDGDDGEVALRLWCTLTRLAPAHLVAAPACLAAFVALCRGSGALANAAIDRALSDNPDYSFAHLLLQIASSGMNPKHVRRVATEATRDVGYSILTDLDDWALDDLDDLDELDLEGWDDAEDEPATDRETG